MTPPRRRATLATRISLLSVGIAVVTVLVAGLLATGLIRTAGSDSARRTLSRLADVAQSVADRRTPRAARRRLQQALLGLDVRFAAITPAGTTRSTAPLVRTAVTPDDTRTVLAGHDVDAVRSVDGVTVFVEARPEGNGGIVVVQRQTDAVAQDERAIRLLLIALVIAGGSAAVIGLLVAWRLARPLRRTAAAAHSLAAGNRDVDLPVAGPAEVAEVADAVNLLAAALRNSEARQRQFLLSVSHDLRTPLTAITGYAESLAGGVIEPEDAGHVGEIVLGESRRLERMVGDLLDLARLDAVDFRIDFAVVDVAALARDAAPVWASRCAADGITFVLDAPSAPLPAHTDGERLRQLLDGLFDNALRVTPAGAPIVLEVRPELDLAGGVRAVVAEIRDGGPGLSDDDLAVAFEQGVLHERYRAVRRVGTGLGLAIVQGLVTRLQAGIEAGHAAEGGARFTVRLPPAA